MACTCPHHVHRTADCKHMVAVDNATDDGMLEAFPSEDEDEPEDCDCDSLGDFPCWPCVRAGRKELPNEPLLQLFLSMARQVTFSDITGQRTLTENADATPTIHLRDNTQQHAADIAAEYFPGRLGLSPRVKIDDPKECDYEGFSGISEPISRLH
ncbi:hypothetical protein SAMN05421858_4778 [Haladaptatus litoreus]|uniref:SWIM-type domain-containing protein n=2 Tax=Haladaptatus litoreus TaxID=553468 RepID=A0A1N7F7M8_9EURY|nr:hypothetical protein SAMN05421858_4778 [Haladaptatus litoreus]